MNYSTNLLATVGDCDSLLTLARMQKTDLDFKQYQAEKKRTNITSTSTGIETDIPSTIAEITAYENVLLNLPEGEAKRNIQSKLTRAEFKLFTLNERRDDYGVLAMLQQEFDVNCIANDLVEIDVYIAALEARKASL